MFYREFNKKIFELYHSRSTSSYAILSFDTVDLQSVIPIDEIKKFDILKSDWHSLLREIENIPQYFGLIAIQSCAASLMQDSDDVTSNAYLLRLVQLLGLTDEFQLEQLFRQKVSNQPVQELIWQTAKVYLKTSLNQDLYLPAETTYAGRYVQYPKSQALFNTEELKRFTPFFIQSFRVKENLEFKFFNDKLQSSLLNIRLTGRMQRLLNDNQKSILCIKQLYNYYNRWDGELFEHSKPQNGSKGITSSVGVDNRKILLIIGPSASTFYLSPENECIPIDKVMSINQYRYFYKKLLILSEIPDNFNEYEESRFIYKNITSYILINKQYSIDIFNFLMNTTSAKLTANTSRHALFEYKPANDIKYSPLRLYFQNHTPVRLQGGLKLNHQTYQCEFGPDIISECTYSVIYKNLLCDYSPQGALPGKYIIRTNDRKDIQFELTERKYSTRPIISKGIGWDLKCLSIADGGDLEGCLIMAESQKKNAVREWICVNLKTNQERRYKNQNSLLSAINQSKS